MHEPCGKVKTDMAVDLDAEGYQIVLSITCEADVLYDLSVLTKQTAFWRERHRLSDFGVTDVKIPIKLKKPWLGKEFEPEFVKLDDFYISEIHIFLGSYTEYASIFNKCAVPGSWNLLGDRTPIEVYPVLLGASVNVAGSEKINLLFFSVLTLKLKLSIRLPRFCTVKFIDFTSFGPITSISGVISIK